MVPYSYIGKKGTKWWVELSPGTWSMENRKIMKCMENISDIWKVGEIGRLRNKDKIGELTHL